MSQQHIVTTSTIDGVTVGNTTTEVVAANTARKLLSLVNDSDEAIYIAIGTPAVMNKGARLNANGGTYNVPESILIRGAVNAICSSGSKNLTVLEA